MSGKDFEPIGRRKRRAAEKMHPLHAAVDAAMIMMTIYMMMKILMTNILMMKTMKKSK